MRVGYRVMCDGCGTYATCPSGSLPGGWVCWGGMEDGILPDERIHLCSTGCAVRLGEPPNVKTANETRRRVLSLNEAMHLYVPARAKRRPESWEL